MDGILILILIGVAIAGLIIFYVFYQNTSSNHPTIKAVKKRLEYMNPKLKNIPLRVANNAYTENKSVVYICLKHPYTGEIYDMNTLIYVTLHEFAHVLTSKYDHHGKEWQDNFSKLLNQAIKAGIYNPNRPIPKDYCAIESRRKNAE